jgi:hypothetical protein
MKPNLTATARFEIYGPDPYKQKGIFPLISTVDQAVNALELPSRIVSPRLISIVHPVADGPGNIFSIPATRDGGTARALDREHTRVPYSCPTEPLASTLMALC